ncbi:TPA: hypothetical protein DEB00_02660 [Candidatus Uhrbacteria bacterium]|nr:hypothetical protein [Candidatus Uhrbacteria bacterium]
MFNHSKKGGGGGYKGRGGSNGGDWKRDGQSSGKPDMHRATCDECRASCEVPFKPNGKKPVLCSDCFRKDDGGRPSYGHSERSDRSDRFEKPSFRSAAPSADNGEVVKQLKALNSKMDQLLDAIANME